MRWGMRVDQERAVLAGHERFSDPGDDPVGVVGGSARARAEIGAATGDSSFLVAVVLVVGIDVGDASTMMHLVDFDTAVRHAMPLLIVVLNDQALGSEYQKMIARNMNAALSTIPTPDLGAVATALGGKGRLAHSIAEVRTAAAEWVAQPGPMIIDARISRNVRDAVLPSVALCPKRLG